ncbi:hypothetical protein B1R32_101170 [Abditibacterium utsteinense]|uniref:Uncharacterized protein n=1 Tax=Abditibacterium utsteinense TaxID=1960156 RepID=A0A2S8SXD4_9BACT|nr:hypothetical protein B1R32_101170 [Abditibacterium utsteinense]
MRAVLSEFGRPGNMQTTHRSEKLSMQFLDTGHFNRKYELRAVSDVLPNRKLFALNCAAAVPFY